MPLAAPLPTQGVIARTQSFVRDDVAAYLACPGNEDLFPAILIDGMREIGLFGAAVPTAFDGLGLDRADNAAIGVAIGAGWQSLSALLGTHARVCLYFAQSGTDQQRKEWLPRLASGTSLTSHAYHEQGNKNLTNFGTLVTRTNGKGLLTGVKQWVTNARDSDLMLVIARLDGTSRVVAGMVDPRRSGVTIGPDLPRAGVRGVSLCEVAFDGYELDLDEDLVGGLEADIAGFISRFEPGSSLGFCGRAVGAAEAAVAQVTRFYESRELSAAHDVAVYKLGLLHSRLHTMQATLWHTVAHLVDGPPEAAHMAKTYCSEALQEIVRMAIELQGGAGYASSDETMSRIYRDSAALILIDTPNDVLFSRIGRTVWPRRH